MTGGRATGSTTSGDVDEPATAGDRPGTRGWVLMVVWSVIEGLPALFSGVLVASAVDRGFLAGDTVRGLGLLGLLGALHLVSGLATRALFPWLAEVVEPLRDTLLRRVVTGSIRSAVAGQPVDLSAVARLTSQVETVRKLVSALIRVLRQATVAAIAALVGLAMIDVHIAGPVAACLLVAAALFVLVSRRMSVVQRDTLLAGETLANEAGRIFAGVRDVVAHNAESRAAAELGALIDVQARAVESAARAVAGRAVVVAAGGYLPLVLLLLIAPAEIRSGALTVGGAVGAATYLSTRLMPAVSSVTGTVGTWVVQLLVVRRRLLEPSGHLAGTPAPGHPAGTSAPAASVRFSIPGTTAVPAGPLTAAVPECNGSPGAPLVLRDVTFRFAPGAAPIVDRLNLRVPPDGHLAVVGPSGVGKSTLTRLITGELQPQGGDVELGGVRLRDLDPRVRHHHLALVPQEAYIFAGTVRENLTYLSPAATDADLDRAGAATGLARVLEQMGGYDARVIPGSLSAGAAQLMTLTRVYLSAARIVILDEATCHLDLGSEKRVEMAFRRRGGMLIVVAHRLASARRARQVLVLDGTAQVLGTHGQALTASPLYGDMFANEATPPKWSHVDAPEPAPG